MSLEKGGRADKVGNRYENFILGKQLLRLVEGKLKAIEVEPLGVEGKGVEYIVTEMDGTRVYYQCKAANKGRNSWSVKNLTSMGIFENAKEHILRSERNEFRFISPLSCGELGSLCDRARRNHSVQDLIDNQLSNNSLRKKFQKCAEAWNLSVDDPMECEKLAFLLSKCYFEQIPRTDDSIQDVEDRIRWMFNGNERSARVALENYANDQGKYGVEISKHDVISYMERNGYVLRGFGKNADTYNKIQSINENHWEAISLINGVFIPRTSADAAVASLMKNQSVVLHGRAGCGKSGCVELVSNYLKEQKILYLRLKLDRDIPRNTAVQYGKDLGLHDSPVYCLYELAGKSPCVLILDQLDALRWTTAHSPTALSVCKELISEAHTANEQYDAHISILLVTRTFDYKCDAGIKQLIAQGSEQEKAWNEIEVSTLTESEVSGIVGAEYENLSNRLKQMLRVPSSLYVWMRLDRVERSHAITSADQLFNKWWRQILKSCELKNTNQKKLTEVVRNIASKMSTRGVFSLRRDEFWADDRSIENLISEGILVNSDTKITFVHQSFLDFFVVQDYLTDIYNGKSMIDFIGDRDCQTPNLRYRFFVLMQELCECDDALFVEQAERILSSDRVRYYYQCIVFDVAAQQAAPSDKLCSFVEEYWNAPAWHEYIYQVVYMGNYPLIRHLADAKKVDVCSGEGMNLLRSISAKAPDYVAEVLRPYCFQKPELDKRLFQCLSMDVDKDSEAMYQLRQELFEKYPELLVDACYIYYRAMKNGSARAIDYIVKLIENDHMISDARIHFPEYNELKAFSEKYDQRIVDEVVPKLVQKTAGMAESAILLWHDKRYLLWNTREEQESTLRQIIIISKFAVCNLAENNPEKVWSTLVCEVYSESLIGNELILAALEKLPIAYVDRVVDWLAAQFPKHIFSYTGSRTDYLAETKHILEKFTPVCSAAVFQKMERCILNWSEPAEWMISEYKERRERSGRGPVYSAYWGFMQKELLPVLAQNRLSKAAKDLIGVLNRNEWVCIPHYLYPSPSSEAKWVTSPVSKYTGKLSDKMWLRIIRTLPEKMDGHVWRETKDAFEDATHEEFAASLGKQAEKEPERFAKLALRFPKDCDMAYVYAVLRAQEKSKDSPQCADVNLTSQLIRRYAKTEDEQLLGGIADIVESRAEEAWAEDVLLLIQHIAQMPIDKEKVERFSEREAQDGWSVYALVFNTPQGRAIRAIISLIFAQEDRLNTFRETLLKLELISEPFIDLALVDCAAACYNADAAFSVTLFKRLIIKNACLLVANYAGEMIRLDYSSDPDIYRKQMISAVMHSDKDYSGLVASRLCAAAIYYKDSKAIKFLLTWNFTEEQAERICEQAAMYFTYDEFRDVSKQLILNVVSRYAVEPVCLSTDFLLENIVIERDKEFLLQLLKESKGEHVLVSVAEFLCETDENIVDFAEIIYAMVKQLSGVPRDGGIRLSVDEIVQCVAHLYDVGKDDQKARKVCLDAWDELYKNNLHDVKALSTVLDDLN